MNIDCVFLIYSSSFIIVVLCGVISVLKQIMKIVKQTYQVGQCVYAKMKFYAPWPALILEIRGRTARVQFFGWQNQW